MASGLICGRCAGCRKSTASPPITTIPVTSAHWPIRCATGGRRRGAAITCFGLVRWLPGALALLAVAGWILGRWPAKAGATVAAVLVLALALVFFIVGLVMSGSALDFWLITILALALGVLMIIPIGGADMPVVISLLNACTGLSAAATGLAINDGRGNTALIVAGMIVGASGSILTNLMAKAMNRSIPAIIAGGQFRK